MADCNNPTFYPVILSSIDGECVFTEYDVSTTLYDRIWNEIEEWAWPCGAHIFGSPPGDPGDPPTSIPNYGWVPNHATPGSTTTIYLTPSAQYGDPNLGGTTTLNTSNCLNNYAGLINPGSNVIAKLSIEGTVKQNATVFAWTADVTNVTGPTTIDSKDVYTLTVANVKDTGQSDWDGAESGTTPFSIQLKSNAPSVLMGLHDVSASGAPTHGEIVTWNSGTNRFNVSTAPTGGAGAENLDDLTDVDIDGPTKGDLLVYNAGDSEWQNLKRLDGNYGIEGQGGVALTLSGASDGTKNVLEVFPSTVLDETTPVAAFTVGANGDLTVGGYADLNTHNIICNSQISIGLDPGQTSAPFVVSDTGGNHIWYIDASANLFTSGGIDVSGNKITQVGTPTATDDAATKLYVDQSSSGVSGDYILKDGSVAFTGNQSMGSNKLTSVTNPTADQDAATKVYVDINTVDVSANYILKAGTVAFTGNQSMGSNKLTSVTNPTANQDAATKYYVDLMASSPSGNYVLVDGSVPMTGTLTAPAVSATSVSGLTVYAPSVSGATVSGTSVKAVLYSGAGILDQDTMSSNSNTHLATQQSIKAYVDSQTHTDDFSYWTAVPDTSSIYYSSGTGGVGIGTASPTAKLEVVGDVSATTVYAPSVSGATLSGTTIEGITVYGTSVSGATVSGTTIEGLTIYAPSVSGATVSATDLIGVTVTGIDHDSLGGLPGSDPHTQYTLVAGTRAFTGAQSMGSNKLTSVTNPTALQDAATKYYVDLMASSPSGNYILRDGSVDFTGAQAGVAFGATEGVSGATVSGTTIEGVTVYGTSVSGATVSGTSVKAVLYSGAGILDQDTLSSDSNTHLATQQSIKAYVDLNTVDVSANYILKDGSVAFTGAQSMGSNKLTSVTDPTALQDAATKYYVDLMASSPSGNYILKDGSVDFTGAQAGIAFGATEGVSGATVSGTTIEGQTVYAPSVSGATVSGTAVKAVLYSGAGILDEDAMGSDSNTHLATQQSIKAYVDSQAHTDASGYWTQVTATSAIYYSSGNVGIGTTTPSATLEVVGDVSATTIEALEGVSGAIVSGTTVEGQTVYATSVSGATVSGTSVKAVLYSGAGILDEDAMGSDSNTHLSTQQAIKAYVDSRTAGAAANYILKDGSVTFTGNQSMGSNKLTSVTDPTADQDAATKVYVDVNTVDVSGNYILKDGSVDFTGAQAGIAFGATEGVSGATVSGTTVEGVTVYAPSVSGATVSATDLIGVTVTGIDHDSLGGLPGSDPHTQYTLVAGTRAFTGNQSMGSNKLTSVTNPTADQDAATKAYVDVNTVDVSGNYILKDGSVDFTGAQAGIAFGATEGVSGATVSGTTVEGVTVYATSVSGATLSGTSVKAVLYSGAGILDEDAMGSDSNTHLSTQQAIKAYVDSRTAGAAANYILKDGSVAFTGDQSMGSNKLTSVTNPTADQDAATKVYVDENTVDVSANYILKTGTVAFTGNQSMGSNKLTSVTNPTADQDAATKVYVDENTVDVSGNYILKDGSVDFTGAQAGIAFGATEGVSGATVSGTTVEGQTVYAPSVSGATVSGTSVKAVLYSGAGILDQDTMSSDSNTHIATQQSIKAYVDSRTAGAAANYILKDGSVDFTGDQSMGSNKLTNVTDPGSAQDAATKAYVDSQSHGGGGGSLWTAVPATNSIYYSSGTNVSAVGIGVTAPHATLEVNGEVSAVSVGATEGVSGATVSGTTVEGQTVYAPSVSGATVSGTAVKAVLYSGAGILDEDAMGSDSNTHLSTQQAIKAYVDSRTAGAAANYILKDGSVDFTGNQSMGSNKLTSVTDPTADQDAATKAYVDVNTVDVSGNYILKDGSVDFTGAQAGIAFGATEGVSGATVSGTTVEGVTVYGTSVSGATVSGTAVKAVLYSGAGILDEDAMGSDSNTHLSTQQAIKAYVDSRTAGAAANYILKDGSVTFTGDQSMGSNKLTSVTDPGSAQDAATKAYVDSRTAGAAANYILKDGSVDFTGAQAGIAFGATEGVSGATVSGTTIEGLTVYATSVSGATVSGTSVKAVLYSGAGILDEDAMGTDSNTHLATQQSIKAYVDSRTAGAAANYILKDGSVAFTGDQSMGSNKLTSVTDPGSAQDAATKAYVDSRTAGAAANYILKDGSVDFTGAQAGIAFGATEGVSGATVSGTTVEGVTVYGTSVSGATVSGTSVKAVLYSGAGILDEDAMGSDSNTHLSTQQAIKAYVDSRTAGAAANYILKDGSVDFTGDQSMGSNKLTSVTDPASAQDAATKAYVDSRTAGAAANYILKDGSVDFTGDQSMGSNKLTSVTDPTADQDAATKAYVDVNTVDVSANYILKDGSVDFTGNQSMGSNKLTSVADPTADRDAATKGYVDENTVDVSGDYILKDGEVSFTGAVAGVSGAGDASLTTNLMCFSRQFHHTAYRSGSFSNGQQIRLFLNTTDNDANFVIPAGNTLKILAAYGRCKSGGTAGTTTWTLGIQTWETQAHSGARDWDLATGSTTDTNSYINIIGRGTLASPLATIVGADDPVGMVFLEHANGGGGSSGNDKHTIDVYGVFVDS